MRVKRTSKALGGILLLFIGLSMLLSMIGIHLGGLIGLVLGAWLMYVGYSKWQEVGWSVSSIALFALGAVLLFGGMGGVVSLAIGVLLVYGGYQLLMPANGVDEEDFAEESSSPYGSLDEEFNRLMNK
jgi:lia operon protein LiaI